MRWIIPFNIIVESILLFIKMNMDNYAFCCFSSIFVKDSIIWLLVNWLKVWTLLCKTVLQIVVQFLLELAVWSSFSHVHMTSDLTLDIMNPEKKQTKSCMSFPISTYSVINSHLEVSYVELYCLSVNILLFLPIHMQQSRFFLINNLFLANTYLTVKHIIVLHTQVYLIWPNHIPN